MKKLLILSLVVISIRANSQIITTIAGNGTAGYNGDGGPATAAEFRNPIRIFPDKNGNIFIVDDNNSVVREVSPAGTVTTIAGTGSAGYWGDGGAATAAQLNNPAGVCEDTAGNVYIADWGNNVIREVSGGIINTVAGEGSPGYSGDGGHATLALLHNPDGICMDKLGNLYFADEFNNAVRRIDPSGIITTMAGTGVPGYSGDKGRATSATLQYPTDVAVDTDINLYIADAGNYVIREVFASDSLIATIAGNGTSGYSGDGGQATVAELGQPAGICMDTKMNIYIGDNLNNNVRIISPNGIISTIAGNGTAGYTGDGGLAIAAELNQPTGIAIDDSSNLLIADYFNNVIRKVTKPWLAGVNDIKTTGEEATVYPNPNHGVFTVQVKSEVPIAFGIRVKSNMEIYNVLGEKIFMSPLGEGLQRTGEEFKIDISDKPKGIYLYRIITESGQLVASGKLIVE